VFTTRWCIMCCSGYRTKVEWVWNGEVTNESQISQPVWAPDKLIIPGWKNRSLNDLYVSTPKYRRLDFRYANSRWFKKLEKVPELLLAPITYAQNRYGLRPLDTQTETIHFFSVILSRESTSEMSGKVRTQRKIWLGEKCERKRRQRYRDWPAGSPDRSKLVRTTDPSIEQPGFRLNRITRVTHNHTGN